MGTILEVGVIASLDQGPRVGGPPGLERGDDGFLERRVDNSPAQHRVIVAAQLEKEAPRYVHLLPQLPRLIHAALQPSPDQQRAMEALLAEQRRTNRLLIAVLVTAIGFVIGLGLMQLAVRWH